MLNIYHVVIATCFANLAFNLHFNKKILDVLLVTFLYLKKMSSQFLRKKGFISQLLIQLLLSSNLCNRKEYELLKEVQQHFLDFFMELVSQCCFSQIAPEESTDAFVKNLLEIVTDMENEDYKSLFPYEEDYPHSCPLARSVLLHLLLEYE